jgi:uncharacterized membrane protein YfcA
MLYLIVGLLAGMLGAMTGLGGGIIMVPVMTILFGVPIHKAVGISIFAIVVNSSIAAVSYTKKGYVDIKLGLALEQSTIIGAIIGALVSGLIDEKKLAFIMGVVLIFASFQMVSPLKRLIAEEDIKVRNLTPLYKIRNISIGIVLSVVAGCAAGMLGVGGGIFKIPIMYLIMDVPIKVAVGTSSFMIMLTSVASGWIFFLRGDIYIEIALFMAGGVALGSFIGSKVGIKLRGKWQTRIVALVLLMAAIKMLLS